MCSISLIYIYIHKWYINAAHTFTRFRRSHWFNDMSNNAGYTSSTISQFIPDYCVQQNIGKQFKHIEFGIVWVSLLFGHSWPMFTLRLLTQLLCGRSFGQHHQLLSHIQTVRASTASNASLTAIVTFRRHGRGSNLRIRAEIWHGSMDHYLISLYLYIYIWTIIWYH